MKVYYSGGNREFDREGLIKHMMDMGLIIEPGVIISAKILERKFLSNKGNALDGFIQMKHCGVGFNIGGNPIGTGYHNYISFLKELDCKKIGHLYKIESIIGKEVGLLTNKIGSHGIITLKGYDSLE